MHAINIDMPAGEPRPPVVSTWQPGKGISSGADLRRACSAAAGQAGKLACVYFLNGVVSDVTTSVMIADRNAGKPFKPVICVPRGTPLDTQLAALVSEVDAQPKLATAPAALTIRVVYGKTWACKP